MARPEQFIRQVILQCSGCGRDVHRDITHARDEFVWCDDCWPDRKRELDRAAYRRNLYHNRKRKRDSDRARKGPPPTCLWPGCEEPRAYHHLKYCKPHSEEAAANK